MTEPLVCLVILDGWGLAPPGPGNAVELASTPVFDALRAAYPHTRLDASGKAVGLPEGQMGNSEVGHTNLGAGRVVRQDLVRIDDDLESGAFFENPCSSTPAGERAARRCTCSGSCPTAACTATCGICAACIELADRQGVERVHVHAFTDGRDTSPTGGAGYLEGIPGVATVCGRYYAMDRDRRFDRVKRAYDAIVHGTGARADDAGGGAAGALRGRRDGRVHPADRDRRSGARAASARATWPSSSTSGPIAPASSRGR